MKKRARKREYKTNTGFLKRERERERGKFFFWFFIFFSSCFIKNDVKAERALAWNRYCFYPLELSSHLLPLLPSLPPSLIPPPPVPFSSPLPFPLSSQRSVFSLVPVLLFLCIIIECHYFIPIQNDAHAQDDIVCNWVKSPTV